MHAASYTLFLIMRSCLQLLTYSRYRCTVGTVLLSFHFSLLSRVTASLGDLAGMEGGENETIGSDKVRTLIWETIFRSATNPVEQPLPGTADDSVSGSMVPGKFVSGSQGPGRGSMLSYRQDSWNNHVALSKNA